MSTNRTILFVPGLTSSPDTFRSVARHLRAHVKVHHLFQHRPYALERVTFDGLVTKLKADIARIRPDCIVTESFGLALIAQTNYRKTTIVISPTLHIRRRWLIALTTRVLSKLSPNYRYTKRLENRRGLTSPDVPLQIARVTLATDLHALPRGPIYMILPSHDTFDTTRKTRAFCIQKRIPFITIPTRAHTLFPGPHDLTIARYIQSIIERD